MIMRVLAAAAMAAVFTWCLFWAFGALLMPESSLGPPVVRNTDDFSLVTVIERPDIDDCGRDMSAAQRSTGGGVGLPFIPPGNSDAVPCLSSGHSADQTVATRSP